MITSEMLSDIRALAVKFIAVKTLEQYTRQLRQYARDYYTGKIDDGAWLDKSLEAVTGQMGRAWREGIRSNGVEEMDEEMQAQLDEIIKSEQDHLTNLADLINKQREADAGMDAINARVETWAARYTDVVNRAKLASSKNNWRFEWIYGDTEHCATCEKLNGTILKAWEWEESEFHPQRPPNEMLDCGGWKCKCKLERTKKKRTGFPEGL